MKIRDLIDFNPDAEVEIIMTNGLPFEGKISYGWSHGGADSVDNRKETATEVCIFLGDFSEKENNIA